ncbi:hypothetical protein Micbo1qcDRAFT_9063 [Microdochium bolleyi]|uniref:Uncharacterized protein n=1 Tax=Microdochium bolleyi TaxID=196109 RepID=A0A136JKF2_9PEZI|nr:hypothetical protein Micbo1qcDRAFT_9063 [Microdochium bolleyi]
MTQVQSPLLGTGPNDDPPLFFGDGSDLDHHHYTACREYPAVRRILGTRAPQKAGSLRHARQQRRTQHHQTRRPRRWEDDGRSLAADSNIVLPSDRRRPMIATDDDCSHDGVATSRRTPRLVRQEAFCAASTSRNWRSQDYVDDDDELYRLGLLYDESRDQRHGMTGSCSPAWTAADEIIQSAHFSLDAISHDQPTYNIRMVATPTGPRNGRPGYRYDHGNEDDAGSDHDSEDEKLRKGEPLRTIPALTLDLSFTAFGDNVQQAWPRHGRQDGRYDHHEEYDSSIQHVFQQQPMQHIIYELDEADHDHDMAEGSFSQCPGTPITQTPELVSDDEDIASDDADWFSLMEDGWTPIEEEAADFSNAGKISQTSPSQDFSGAAHAGDTWVVLGRGMT